MGGHHLRYPLPYPLPGFFPTTLPEPYPKSKNPTRHSLIPTPQFLCQTLVFFSRAIILFAENNFLSVRNSILSCFLVCSVCCLSVLTCPNFHNVLVTPDIISWNNLPPKKVFTSQSTTTHPQLCNLLLAAQAALYFTPPGDPSIHPIRPLIAHAATSVSDGVF